MELRRLLDTGVARQVKWSLIVGLAALTLLRLLIAAGTPLAPDEAYYWTWSKVLAPGYLDHPPMIALWIRLGTALAGDDPVGVRLLAPFACLSGSLLAARAGGDLLGLGHAQRLAVIVLLNATLMVGVGAVTMTPDTPLLFFWTLALACFGRALRTGDDSWLIAAFAAIGLAFDSKYTAVLLLPAAAIWLVGGRGLGACLSSWRLWLAAGISLLITAPVLAWNDAHHFASFAKQGGRAGDIHLSRALRFISELILGQLGLATPLIAMLLVLGVWHLGRGARRAEQGARLVLLATLIPALVFLVHAAGDRVQANWPSVLYPTAAIAAASIRPPNWLAWPKAALLGAALTGLVYLQGALHPLVLPGRLDPSRVRLAGWGTLTRDAIAQSAIGHCRLVADDYGLSAELAWHGATVLGLDSRWAYTTLPHAPAGPGCLLLVRTARRDTPPDPALFADTRPAGQLDRAGVERYRLIRVTIRPGIDLTSLPRHLL
jgi:4-amino-4-deoxy-L-arabinose transferase-like glycosyltransferase